MSYAYRASGCADLPTLVSVHGPDTIMPEGYRFPRFMLLAFTRPR